MNGPSSGSPPAGAVHAGSEPCTGDPGQLAGACRRMVRTTRPSTPDLPGEQENRVRSHHSRLDVPQSQVSEEMNCRLDLSSRHRDRHGASIGRRRIAGASHIRGRSLDGPAVHPRVHGEQPQADPQVIGHGLPPPAGGLDSPACSRFSHWCTLVASASGSPFCGSASSPVSACCPSPSASSRRCWRISRLGSSSASSAGAERLESAVRQRQQASAVLRSGATPAISRRAFAPAQSKRGGRPTERAPSSRRRDPRRRGRRRPRRRPLSAVRRRPIACRPDEVSLQRRPHSSAASAVRAAPKTEECRGRPRTPPPRTPGARRSRRPGSTS